jgi:hypothetical protein
MDSYVLQVQYCDSSGQADTTQIFQIDSITNIIDTLKIDSVFFKQGLQIGCGQYYKITLTVMNECTDPISTSKIIKIDCPGMGLAGSDKCCDAGTLVLGDSGVANYKYDWLPKEYLSSYDRSFATFLPTGSVVYPKTYYLTATDTLGGCSSVDTVSIFCSSPNCPIIQRIDSCSGASTFSTNCNRNFSYLNWVIQENHKDGTKSYLTYTSDSIKFRPSEDTSFVYLTAVNPCGLYIDTAFIYGGKHPYDTLMFATAVSKSSPIEKNRKLIFLDPNTDTISGHAYYDYYALRVQYMDRNGQIYNGPVFHNPGGVGFINGTFYWEPKFANGNYLPNGEYQINVQYKKCTEKDEWLSFYRLTQLEYTCQLKGTKFQKAIKKARKFFFGIPICKDGSFLWVPHSAWGAKVIVYE